MLSSSAVCITGQQSLPPQGSQPCQGLNINFPYCVCACVHVCVCAILEINKINPELIVFYYSGLRPVARGSAARCTQHLRIRRYKPYAEVARSTSVEHKLPNRVMHVF